MHYYKIIFTNKIKINYFIALGINFIIVKLLVFKWYLIKFLIKKLIDINEKIKI